MAMQWSDTVKALRTKDCRYCSGHDRLGNAFCEKVRRPANKKIVFGNAWKLQILAAVIGSPSAWSQRLAKKQRPPASQKCVDFETVVENPNRVKVAQALQWQRQAAHAQRYPLSLMQQLRGGESAWPGLKASSVCRVCSG